MTERYRRALTRVTYIGAGIGLPLIVIGGLVGGTFLATIGGFGAGLAVGCCCTLYAFPVPNLALLRIVLYNSLW